MAPDLQVCQLSGSRPPLHLCFIRKQRACPVRLLRVEGTKPGRGCARAVQRDCQALCPKAGPPAGVVLYGERWATSLWQAHPHHPVARPVLLAAHAQGRKGGRSHAPLRVPALPVSWGDGGLQRAVSMRATHLWKPDSRALASSRPAEQEGSPCMQCRGVSVSRERQPSRRQRRSGHLVSRSLPKPSLRKPAQSPVTLSAWAPHSEPGDLASRWGCSRPCGCPAR